MAGDTRPHSIDNTRSPSFDRIQQDHLPTRHSVDEPPKKGPSIDDSPTMSRSSSKSSSLDTNSKSSKPKRPTNYAERKSSITQRGSLTSQLKTLALTPAIMNTSPISTGVQSPHAVTSPSTSNHTPTTPKPRSPILERRSRSNSVSPTETEPEVEDVYFPLQRPSRPEVDVPRASAVQMYWHQPPMHGMMTTGPARRSHSIAQVGSQFFIIGGSDGKPPKATNTVYIFDADTFCWRIPKVGGTFPPPLRAHTTSVHRQKIYLFGGGTGNNEYYNHVYCFSTQRHQWSSLQDSNRTDPSLPTARRAHTSVVFDGGMFIFGGGSGTAGLNDLWRFDLTSHKWTKLRPIGRKPEPRVYHTATVVRDVMIIYGGLDGKQCFSNMFLYNFHANTYTELSISGPRLARISHTTTCVGSQLFVFGGSNGSVFNNEVWIFDLVSRTWSLRGCEGQVPMARGYHVAAFWDARLWVFGGMDTVWEGFTDVSCLEFAGSGYLGSVYVDHVR